MTAIQPQTSSSTASTPDFQAIKSRQRATWSAGDYGRIGTTVQICAEILCETIDLRAGERVLDVATGTGNAALAAARRYAHATGVDYVPSLLAQGRERALAEHLPIELLEGDAEDLRFDDGAFDVVLSTFGVMFAPNQERTASELIRVCRAGGRIGLVSWTPESFIGGVFRIIGRYIPPAPGLRSPALWGSPQRIEELFGKAAATIDTHRRLHAFRYESAEHWLEVFRRYYGPVQKAFDALAPDNQALLERDMLAHIREHDRGGGNGLVVPSEYLEVVITKSA